MRYCGVDPGLRGAIAFLDEHGQVEDVIATPLKAKGDRETYDVRAIAAIFRQRIDRDRRDRGLHVTVEDLQTLPAKRPRFKGGPLEDMGGGYANFARGVAHGWEFMLAAFWIEPLMVIPQTWQADMLVGTDPRLKPKERSILQASRLFPERCLVCGIQLERPGGVVARTGCIPAADHPRRKKPHDGFADALLLAQYGRQQHKGGAVFAAAR